MSREISDDIVLALVGNVDKAIAYDMVVKKISRFLSERIDKHGIYEIEEENINDLAKDLAGEIFLSDELDRDDGFFSC